MLKLVTFKAALGIIIYGRTGLTPNMPAPQPLQVFDIQRTVHREVFL